MSQHDGQVVIYKAKKILTLDTSRPVAEVVAVASGRVLACGTLEEVKGVVGDRPYTVNSSLSNHIIVPGFIAQHDHPALAALTMSSEILSIEDWALPSGTVPAVKSKEDFMTRLAAAEAKMADPDEALLTWGYHPSFYGKLISEELDTISATRPIIVWGRSCHEFFFNCAAMTKAGLSPDVIAGWSESAREQCKPKEGHFWEQAMFSVLPNIMPILANPQRLKSGLELVRDYMQVNGVTFGNEPGGIVVKPLQDAINGVFSLPTMPFRWSFMVDGKSMCNKYEDDAEVLAESEVLKSWYHGMTSLHEGSVKLFADGAIYSLLMQVREPYTDGHHGEWMTDLDVFERAFRIYWDAGYQIHIHVNGDAGLDRVLNALQQNMTRNPRDDHRTTIVHFAVCAPDQVATIKRLGAIVSGNSYYVTALADKYGEEGLGPERADQMVRLGDLEREGISYSLHSDMPMAPAQPLFLMHCAVNRTTQSGRVAGPEQCVSREGALRAVTLEAAYSLRREHDLGSIVQGKVANLTILADDPVTCEATKIKDIQVWGTMHEGRLIPVSREEVRLPPRGPLLCSFIRKKTRSFNDVCGDGEKSGCACSVGKFIGALMLEEEEEGEEEAAGNEVQPPEQKPATVASVREWAEAAA